MQNRSLENTRTAAPRSARRGDRQAHVAARLREPEAKLLAGADDGLDAEVERSPVLLAVLVVGGGLLALAAPTLATLATDAMIASPF